jgi:hypothetical protein
MHWDVHFAGSGPLSSKEATLSFTQSALMINNNVDFLTAYWVQSPPQEGARPGWVRYSGTALIPEKARMDLFVICYTFSKPGRYLFKPPVLTIILPGGERRPYPD